jgi:hypothetical protein
MSNTEKVVSLFLAVTFTTMSWVMLLTTVGISISTALLPAVVLAWFVRPGEHATSVPPTARGRGALDGLSAN